ncbi:MAG: hypothetical protein PHO27_07970 [Sulfuricurvum sp.]|nr:hypothetical protein [Sulfuricurvum sp.]
MALLGSIVGAGVGGVNMGIDMIIIDRSGSIYKSGKQLLMKYAIIKVKFTILIFMG